MSQNLKVGYDFTRPEKGRNRGGEHGLDEGAHLSKGPIVVRSMAYSRN